MKKKINSVWLVLQYLINHDKCYIHDMKKVCKCNNVAERIRQLRYSNHIIDTVKEKVVDGIPVYYYRLKKQGTNPKQLR